MDEKGIHMDPETKAEFERIEGRLELALQKSIQTAIKEGFREIKDHIAELFNKDIEHINEHLTRHDKYHQEHYSAEKKIWKAIDDIKLSTTVEIESRMKPVMTELEGIKDVQLSCSISQETAEKIEDKKGRQSEITWGKVAGIGGIIALIFTAIGYFINA